MSLIKHIKTYPAKKHGQKKALLLCGFGGSIWQTKRLTGVLRRAGYQVIAMDFPEAVLSQGDPKLLPALADEVVAFAESEANKADKPILLVGISLGALVAVNILRRSKLFNEAVLITGGDIVTVAQHIYGPRVWPQSYEELAKLWQGVNMYTDPAKLVGKRMLFVLPAKDKLIDTDTVRREVQAQNEAGNKLIMIERHTFGHVGTIIEETILFPKRILNYIRQVESA